ncbi:SET domain-containing protein [Thozetella sp. PMI_491]|nr:SET domain-containing protein [Thozetella sp. PMI_491]
MASAPPALPGTRIAGTSGVGRGRSLIATRSFAPAELIASFSSPIIALPDGDRMRLMCNYCLRRAQLSLSSLSDLSAPPSQLSGATDLKACTGCRCAMYCGAACQRAHWKDGHKKECAVFQRVRERAGKDWLPTPVRAVLQVMAKLRGDGVVAQAFGPGGWLEGNVEGFKQDKQVWEDIELQSMAAVAYGGLPMEQSTLEAAKEIFCKIQTNAFDRSDADTGMAGIFLEPSLAMVNHSCIPNAFVSFDKRAAFLRAEREIREGEEIQISYIDYTLPRSARQGALRAYHFECTCPRCEGDLDVYQVCKTSPLVPLNVCSLMPDLDRLRGPPVDEAFYQRVSKQEVESIFKSWHGISIDQAGGVMERASLRWKLCRPLIEARMWAVEPLASSIFDLAIVYQTSANNYVYALALVCFHATECTPYKLVAPFNAFRVKGVLVIAKLLSQTAALQVDSHSLPKGCPKELAEVLAKSDQVSMCEAMLRLVVHYAPSASSEDWDVLHTAAEMLEDIKELSGRETESSLLAAWVNDPEHFEGKHFFEEQVLKPVYRIAEFAVGIIEAEVGGSFIVPSR